MVIADSRPVIASAGGLAGAATRDRLRALIRAIESRTPVAPSPVAAPASAVAPTRRGPPSLEVALRGARLRETASGHCVVREVRLPLAADGDRVACGEAFDLSALPHLAGAPLVRLAPDADLDDATIEDLLFLDIETTGLGGAGAMAFLVATGRVERECFVLRQYIAPSPPAEAALLEALIEDTGIRTDDPVLVTYNGRMFDAPMLDGRATMHRQRGGFEALRHLDLLLPARIAYRGLLRSCRLVELEHALLGMTRPPSEASGAEAPGWYFRFLRTGDARMLAPIVEHNARDVVALAALTARIAALAAGEVAAGGVDALAAGRLLAARGELAAACTHLERAGATLAPRESRVEALSRLAALHKAAGRRDLAAPLWHRVGEESGAGALRAWTELAIYYERHARDLPRALEVVDRALDHVGRLERLDPARAARAREPLLQRRSRVHSRLARSTSTR